MPRGRHIARALRTHLPQDVPAALDILIASIDPPRSTNEGSGLAPFLYLPHTVYVADYALDHFDAAMRAQHALTQRFTAEFSIRPFIEKYPARTLAQLRQWTNDPSPHVGDWCPKAHGRACRGPRGCARCNAIRIPLLNCWSC
jgi:hypothetical protein